MEEENKKLATAGAVFRTYIHHVRKHPWLFTLVVAAGIGIQAATLAAPLYARQFFNLLAGGVKTSATVDTLVHILIMIGLIYLLEWVFRRLQGVSNSYMSAEIMSSLYTASFSNLITHSHNFFISNFAGSLTHKVSKFVHSFETLFDTIVVSFFPTFLFVMGAIGVLFVRNHYLGIALAAWSVLFIWFQLYVSRYQQPIREERSRADTKVTGGLADAISNQSTIALFAGEKNEQERFSKLVTLWSKVTLRLWNVSERIWGGIGLFMTLIEVSLLYLAVLLWQKDLLTIGDFVLIQSYLLTTFDRLVSINRELRRFFDAVSDSGEMVAILETPQEIRDIPNAKTLTVRAGEIAFKNVDFYFHSTRHVLKDFTLTIHPDEMLALVGPSGAGKSTVTKILLRLFDIAKGTILIDGQNIKNVTQESLRSAISFVPQEAVLFHRSLMENIRYGRRDATDNEVLEAARKAHCHEFISGLPLGYNTLVGERGVKLSGGERQRVAIARALLKDAPILVLDEATSSLDSESEALIQDALSTLMQGKTVIVIAHRLSTIMKMDRIVVIEDGGIVAEGSHDELLLKGGLYQKLWSIQAGGFIADTEEKE